MPDRRLGWLAWLLWLALSCLSLPARGQDAQPVIDLSTVGGTLPLVSVRLTNAIPKDRIFDVMREINGRTLTAPTHIGDIVIKNILGLDSDVIVTKNIQKV